MEEENKNPIQEPNEEKVTEQPIPAQEPVNVEKEKTTTESKFKPLGEVNEKPPKKKKRKVKGVIFILLLLIAAIAGLAYYYFEVYTNPQIIYQQIVKTGINSLAITPENITTLKANAKLDVDINLNEEYMEDGVDEILNVINNIDAAIEIQMDTTEKKAIFKLDSNYENEELVNCDMMFDAKNKGTYVELSQFFEKTLEVELEDEYYEQLETAFEIEKMTEEQKAKQAKAIKILNEEFSKIIKEEYCSKETEKITIDSKEKYADRYTLKMTGTQLINELKTTIENLKNNEEFLNCFEDKEEGKENLETALKELKGAKISEEVIVYVKLYRTLLKQEFIRVDFEVEAQEQKLVLKVEKIDSEYRFAISFEDETYCTGTILAEKTNEKTTRTTLRIESAEIGTIVLNLEYGYVLNEEIDTMDIENAVKIDELSQADMLRVSANLLESKLYELIEQFSNTNTELPSIEIPGLTEDEPDNEPETPDITDDEQISEIEKNITSSGVATQRNTFVVFAKNNNDVAVDMDIEVEFYDSEGKFLGSSSDDLIAVGAGREVAIETWNTPANYATYTIYVDAEETDTNQYFDQIEITHNNNGENVVVQVKNNSDDTIQYITASVVYYNQGNVVGIADGIVADVRAGRSGNFNLDYPYNSEYEDIEFDDYKVFVTEAYSYN